MSEELWEDYRSIEKDQQEQRAIKRNSAPEQLKNAGVKFESKNEGAHLIIRHKGQVIDFWPGTERWKPQGFKRNFGINKLLSFIAGI